MSASHNFYSLDENLSNNILSYLDLEDLGVLLKDEQIAPIVTRFIQEPADLIVVSSFDNAKDLLATSPSNYAYVRVINNYEDALYFVDKKLDKHKRIDIPTETFLEIDSMTATCNLFGDVPKDIQDLKNNYLLLSDQLFYEKNLDAKVSVDENTLEHLKLALKNTRIRKVKLTGKLLQQIMKAHVASGNRVLSLSQHQQSFLMKATNHLPSTDIQQNLNEFTELHHKDIKLHQQIEEIKNKISEEVKKRGEEAYKNLPWYKKIWNSTVSTTVKFLSLIGIPTGLGGLGYHLLKEKNASAITQAEQDAITMAQSMAEAKSEANTQLQTFLARCPYGFKDTMRYALANCNVGGIGFDIRQTCGMYVFASVIGHEDEDCQNSDLRNYARDFFINRLCVQPYQTYCFTSTNPNDYYDYNNTWEKSANATLSIAAFAASIAGAGYLYYKWQHKEDPIERQVMSEYKTELDSLHTKQTQVRDQMQTLSRVESIQKLIKRIASPVNNNNSNTPVTIPIQEMKHTDVNNDSLTLNNTSSSTSISIDIEPESSTPLLSSNSTGSVTQLGMFTTSSASRSSSSNSTKNNNTEIEFTLLPSRS